MRGLRRHQNDPGLDDDRRTLIHRYMVDQARQQDTVEHVIELAVAEPKTPAAPVPASSVLDLVPPATEHLDFVPPAPEHLDFVPPAPERREGGAVSVEVFRRTLEQVVGLSAQVSDARGEFSRRRERLAAG